MNGNEYNFHLFVPLIKDQTYRNIFVDSKIFQSLQCLDDEIVMEREEELTVDDVHHIWGFYYSLYGL